MIKKLLRKLARIIERKEKAISEENYEEAGRLYEIEKSINKQIDENS